jgi:cell division septal protein FtsQ
MKSERRGQYSDEARAELNANFTRGTTLTTFRASEREKSDRQKERDLRAWRRKLSGILLIILLVSGLGLLTLTQFSGSFNEVISNVPTLQANDADRYKDIINDYLSKNPFERFNFARRNDNLTNYVAEQTPEIKSVTISQAGMLLGKVRLDFREPVAMWTTFNTDNYVDAEGVVFARNYFAVPTVVITDNSGAVVGGGAVASSRFLGFVGQVTAELKKNGEAVERVVIPVGAIRYVEFYLTGRKYPFRAQIDREAAGQAADIINMAKYLDNNKITPTYVDSRVAGKSYWK